MMFLVIAIIMALKVWYLLTGPTKYIPFREALPPTSTTSSVNAQPRALVKHSGVLTHAAGFRHGWLHLSECPSSSNPDSAWQRASVLEQNALGQKGERTTVWSGYHAIVGLLKLRRNVIIIGQHPPYVHYSIYIYMQRRLPWNSKGLLKILQLDSNIVAIEALSSIWIIHKQGPAKTMGVTWCFVKS